MTSALRQEMSAHHLESVSAVKDDLGLLNRREMVAMIGEQTRACKKCGNVYPLNRDNFGSMPAGGLRHTCRKCVRERVHQHDNASPERKKSALERVQRRRHASLSLAERETIVSKIIKRDGGRRCFYCTKQLEAKLHIDHKTPVVKGGNNDLINLVLACLQCNQEKHNKDIDEYRAWLRKNRLAVRF